MKHSIYAILLSIFTAIWTTGTRGDETRLATKWQSLDADGDGAVSLAELHPIQARVMSAHDTDGDGNISLAEYVSYDRDPGNAANVTIPDGIELIEDLPYAATSDPRQRLDLFLPGEPTAGKPLPVIAYIHGGGWQMGSKVMARHQMIPLVATGRFAAVSIGYRLSWQSTWPAQIHDVKAGIRWVRANADKYGLDPSRICAFGPSAGGHLAAMLGTTNGVGSLEGDLGQHVDQASDVLCAVDFFGPTELRNRDARDHPGEPSTTTKLLGAAPADVPDLAASASPVYHVDGEDVPFLIVHGTRDPLVEYSQSELLAAALREAGVPATFVTVKGGGHGDFAAVFPELNARVAAFLEKHFYDATIEVPADAIAME
jgi:acetyl esterase/lipase